jgi:hypothetical protein
VVCGTDKNFAHLMNLEMTLIKNLQLKIFLLIDAAVKKLS